jgi:hypothetical protein
LIALSAVTANASPAAAACIAMGWTNGRTSQPIWKFGEPPRQRPHQSQSRAAMKAVPSARIAKST